MKSFIRQLTTLSALTATTLSGVVALSSDASAVQFGQQPIADERVVAVAEPVNNGRFYKLLIIEQLSTARQCWQEEGRSPTIINPLLITFNFSGICGRSSDSNGYSVRVGGEDLGSRYRLQVEQQGDVLVLVAAPSPLQRGLPKLELGRSNGIANDFVKLELDAGWTLTRRVFNGQVLGHTYITNNQSLDAVIASSGASPAPSRPIPRPTTPTTPPPVSGNPLPRPGNPLPRPGNPLPRPSNPSPGNNATIDYQVIVPGSSNILRSRVNLVEPGAFRTTVNGQAVIQAGRFREQSRANELRQRLVQAGLSAQIIETAQGNIPSRPAPSQPTPSQPAPSQPAPAESVIYQVIVPGSSNILRSRVNAVESGAFRTTVNGQAVIQAGRFQEQPRAEELRQRLTRAGLSAQIVETTGGIAPSTPNQTVIFQVIVPGSSDRLRSQVNAVEPGAFRTTVNGQSVIQAGRFREQSRANELQRRLTQAGLSARVVETTGVIPPSTPNQTVIFQVIVPGSSRSLRSRVDAIEPGAFPTRVNGQAVIQAGRFREQPRAQQLERRLQAAGLDARIVRTTDNVRPSNPSPARRGEILVMIDPGHGGRDPGAVGRNGLLEKDINLFISRRVQQTLERRGYRAALTRTRDVELDLRPRVDIAERANATVFVSIHSNAISLSRPEVNGLETYFFSSGRTLARTIHSSILRNVNIRDRGVRQARFFVLRNTSMPSVLVETGFVTGREDAARFQSNAAREQIADAIAEGIIDFLR